MSSRLYRGRAVIAGIGETAEMQDDWRERLEKAIQGDGRTLRDISLAAGLSHGYLHGILRDGKEPTLDRFIRICRELGVSSAYALTGADVSLETEEVLRLIEGDQEARRAFLALLRRGERAAQ
jgi:transcriptional regulator with XRE-family HTH domain